MKLCMYRGTKVSTSKAHILVKKLPAYGFFKILAQLDLHVSW